MEHIKDNNNKLKVVYFVEKTIVHVKVQNLMDWNKIKQK